MKKTQRQEVLLYLKKHGKITTLEAANKLCIADLQSVIRDLRKKMDIDFEWVYKRNIYGRPVRFKRYFCPKESKVNTFLKLFLKGE